MNVWEAVDKAIAESETTRSNVSIAMGRSRQFVSTAISQKNVPLFDTAIKMFAACGYTLFAMKEPPKGAIVIDEPIERPPDEE